MAHRSSRSLRVAYICCVLGIVAPVGLSASSWVGISMGRAGVSSIPAILSLVVLLALGVWRIWVVGADRTTLDAPQTHGALSATRILGIVFLYIGAVVFLLNVAGRPLIRALITRPSENGIEYFIAGVYLAFLGGLGSLGLVLFEYSRIRSFEKSASLGDS